MYEFEVAVSASEVAETQARNEIEELFPGEVLEYKLRLSEFGETDSSNPGHAAMYFTLEVTGPDANRIEEAVMKRDDDDGKVTTD